MRPMLKSLVLRTIQSAGYDLVKRTIPKPSVAPSRFLVTVPKSGSVYIARALVQTLCLSPLKASPGYFPSDNIDLEAMRRFRQGGFLAQSHIDPSPFQLSLLSRFATPWLGTFRD